MRGTYAGLKNDFVFRKVFGEHPDALMGLLNDLLDLHGDASVCPAPRNTSAEGKCYLTGNPDSLCVAQCFVDANLFPGQPQCPCGSICRAHGPADSEGRPPCLEEQVAWTEPRHDVRPDVRRNNHEKARRCHGRPPHPHPLRGFVRARP